MAGATLWKVPWCYLFLHNSLISEIQILTFRFWMQVTFQSEKAGAKYWRGSNAVSGNSRIEVVLAFAVAGTGLKTNGHWRGNQSGTKGWPGRWQGRKRWKKLDGREGKIRQKKTALKKIWRLSKKIEDAWSIADRWTGKGEPECLNNVISDLLSNDLQ